MNKYLLMASVAIMTLGIASESWAVTCEFNTDPNNEGKYTLVVKGDAGGSAFTTNSCTNIPNGQSWGQIKKQITSASFDSNVTSIGYQAFYYAESLQSVDMPNVTSIGFAAFAEAKSLQSVDMPNVTSISDQAFQSATSLQSVDMPNVTSIGKWAFLQATSLSYAGLNPNISSDDIASYAFDSTKINVCGTGDKYSNCNYCTNSYTNANISGDATIYQPSTTGNTGSCVATCADGYTASNGLCKKNQAQSTPSEPEVSSGGDTGGSQESEQQSTQGSGQATSAADCAASGKYWQDGKCVSSCGASFKLNDGWCDRQRYTPAEAAKVLTNDNNNSVTITFKK